MMWLKYLKHCTIYELYDQNVQLCLENYLKGSIATAEKINW